MVTLTLHSDFANNHFRYIKFLSILFSMDYGGIMSDTQSTWHDIHNLLESQRAQTIDAIRNYPPPIPACDAQFNYLLEKRDQLSVELNRLQTMCQTDGGEKHSTQDLVEFMANSKVINDDTKQNFRYKLQRSQE